MTNPNDEQDWLDALAGKPNPNADPEVTRRATLLRQAIQRHDAALGVNDFDVEAGLQKLKFRMRREGLSGDEQHKTLKNRFGLIAASLSINRHVAQYAMAASVVLAVGLMAITYHPQEAMQNEAENLAKRGGIRTQVIFAKNPADTASSLVANLALVGRAARIENASDRIVVHVDDAVANQSVESHNKEMDLFERYSITVGGTKAFQVEIRLDSKPEKDGR